MPPRPFLLTLPLLLIAGLAWSAEPAPLSLDADSTFALWFRPGADPLRALSAFERVKLEAARLRSAAKGRWSTGSRRFSDPGVAFLFPFFLPDQLGKLPRKPYPATPDGYAFEILEADARASLRALYASALTDEEHLAVLTRLAGEYRKIAGLPPARSAPRAELEEFAARAGDTQARIESLQRLRAAELGELRTLAGAPETSAAAGPHLAHLAAMAEELSPPADLPLSSWEERQAMVLSLFAMNSSWETGLGLVTRAEDLPVEDEQDPFARFRLRQEYPLPPFHLVAARLTSEAERPLRERGAALAEERPRLLEGLRREISGASEGLRVARVAEAAAAKAYGAVGEHFVAGTARLPDLLAAAEEWSDASDRRVERQRDLDEVRLRLGCALAPEDVARAKP